MGLTRLRLGVLAAVYIVLGTSAGGVFDRFIWVLAVAPVVPIGLVLLTVTRPGVLRIGAGRASFVGGLWVGGRIRARLRFDEVDRRRAVQNPHLHPSRTHLVGYGRAGEQL